MAIFLKLITMTTSGSLCIGLELAVHGVLVEFGRLEDARYYLEYHG